MIYFNLYFRSVYIYTHHGGKPEQGHQEEETIRKVCLLACPPASAQLAFSQVQTHLPREGASHSRLGLHVWTRPSTKTVSCRRCQGQSSLDTKRPSSLLSSFQRLHLQGDLLVMTLSFICFINTSTPSTAFSKSLITWLSSQGTICSLNHLKSLYNTWFKKSFYHLWNTFCVCVGDGPRSSGEALLIG